MQLALQKTRTQDNGIGKDKKMRETREPPRYPSTLERLFISFGAFWFAPRLPTSSSSIDSVP
eukprot:2276483-Amphidinium_carterae.1